MKVSEANVRQLRGMEESRFLIDTARDPWLPTVVLRNYQASRMGQDVPRNSLAALIVTDCQVPSYVTITYKVRK